MTVIAMTREMGTRGKDIATGVAETLGLEVVHHELVEQHVAERMDLSENAVHRFLEGEASLWERWKIDSRRLSQFTSQEILERAIKGNVIIRGWGAAQLLRSIPHLICVRVCAPMRYRTAEMMGRLGVDDEFIARREIERSDAAHARVIETRFNRDWRNPTGYDMVINTGFVSISFGIHMMCEYARSIGAKDVGETATALKDKLLEERARTIAEMARDVATVGGDLQVSVSDGAVTLSGMVENTSGLSALTKKVEDLDGVKSVTMDIGTLPASFAAYGP